ncbi:Clhm-1p [Globodera pallida]|nr:Clhm-1p [Globodera pallida]
MSSTQQQESAILSTLQSLSSKYGPAVLNALIVLSTVSGQSIVKRLTFACPCAFPQNVLQSSIFIFGPCLALFLFSVLINQNTWRLVHGCFFRSPSTRHPFSTSVLYWIQIFAQSFVAPIAWLFVCLLDGDYYSCLRAAEFCSNSERCPKGNAVQHPEIEFLNNSAGVCDACVCALDPPVLSYLQSQSQVLAWTLLISTGIVALIVTCLIRMCDQYTFVQSQYVKMYRETEQKVFVEMAKEMANSVASKNSREFFSLRKQLKEDWDALSSLPTLEDPFMFPRHFLRGPGQFVEESWGDNYTNLQKWNRRRGKVTNGETEVPNGIENRQNERI